MKNIAIDVVNVFEVLFKSYKIETPDEQCEARVVLGFATG